jgi:hypothetical protein
MVFAFPSGLNPDIYPLAWLVGVWEGVGEVSYHEQVPTSKAFNRITFSHDGGSYLQYESVIKLLGAGEADLPGPVLESESADSEEVQALLAKYSGNTSQPDENDSAASSGASDTKSQDLPSEDDKDANDELGTLALTEAEIEAAPVWSREMGFWRVSPIGGNEGRKEFALDVFITDAGGRLMYFNGEASPARVELATAKIIRAQLAAEVDGSKRMYGYISDQLAWAEDLVAFGHDLGSYASFLLKRVVDGDGNPVTE